MKSLIYLSIFITAVSGGVVLGRKAVHFKGRITNGTIGRPGQFPYQVGLSLAIGLSSAWCGGTIISERWVLTAAHCSVGVDGVTIYFGAFDIKNASEVGQQRIYCSKSNIFVHKGYTSSAGADDDIALIKLPVPIEFNKSIQPAVLPKKSEKNSFHENEIVVAAGWGEDSDNATTVSQYLQYIEVVVMKQHLCAPYYFYDITDNMICITTVDNKSTCHGDSGGPLVHHYKDVNYVIGVNSFGISLGCEAGWPVVFTRVTSYLDWIEHVSGIVNK